MISKGDAFVNFAILFCPLDGQQTVEVFRLGRADVLQDMGEPLLGIHQKLHARTEEAT